MFLDEKTKSELKQTISNSGVIAYVTDTVWGLGCNPDDEKAVKKIYEIKKREPQKPLILMSCDMKYLLPYVQEIPKKAQQLIDKYFPGALTIILKKSDKTKNFITSNFDTVGIRIPNNAVFKEICETIDGHVLATTSANLSHEPSAKSYAQALENMGKKADMVLEDYGQTCEGLESTVVLVQGDDVKVLRQGAIVL